MFEAGYSAACIACCARRRGTRRDAFHMAVVGAAASARIILSRIITDSDALPRQATLYRDFVRGIFIGT